MGDGVEKIFVGSCCMHGPLIIIWSYITYNSHFVSDLQVITLVACLLAISALTNLIIDAQSFKNDNAIFINPLRICMQYAFFSTFDIAHWIFAYSYYAISQRIKSKETHKLNKRLKETNIVMLLLNLVVPAVYCIFLTTKK